MAPGAVSACLVRADGGAGCAALDAGEVGAVNEDRQTLEAVAQPVSQSEIAAFLGILKTACDRLHGLEGKLETIAKIGFRLEAVEKGQEQIANKIDRSAQAHQSLQEKYLDQSHKHEIEILAINGRIKDYEEVARTVTRLDKNVSAYVLLAVVGGGMLGALFAGLPAWLDRMKHSKTGTMTPPALVRWRG